METNRTESNRPLNEIQNPTNPLTSDQLAKLVGATKALAQQAGVGMAAPSGQIPGLHTTGQQALNNCPSSDLTAHSIGIRQLGL